MLKKRISDIFDPTMIGVAPKTHVSEAIKLMRVNNISCILVLENDRPVGIFTERNIVWYAAHQGLDFCDQEISKLMTSPVLTATSNMYIYEAFNLLTTKQIRHIVVVDDQGCAMGVLTQSNMLEHLGYDDFLEIKKVSQVMTKFVCVISGDETVSLALKKMAEKRISCVIIAEDDFPLGILTERDVTQMVTEQSDVDHLKLREVMSSPAQTVSGETAAYEAVCVMLKKRIRRLVVVDQGGKIEGLATQSDIVKALEAKYIEILKQAIKKKDAVLQDTVKDLYEKTLYLDNILRSSIDMGIIATDINFRIIYYNPAAEKIMGYHAKDVIGSETIKIHVREKVELPRFNRAINRIEKGSQHVFTFEQHKETGKRYIRARVSGIWDKDKELIGFVLMLRDITERKKAEDTIRYMAYHDFLTGLPNRESFNDRLSLEIANAQRNKHKLAIMVIDLNRFKGVNDTLGHHAGDILLKSVATRMTKFLRKSDTVARMGGDEFMLILPQIQEDNDSILLANKIVTSIEAPFEIEGHTVRIGASIGIALYPVHGKDIDTLIRTADNAMYRAKEPCRNNFGSNISFYSKQSSTNI